VSLARCLCFFLGKEHCATFMFSHIHGVVYGFISPHVLVGGYKCFITFTDFESCDCYEYLKGLNGSKGFRYEAMKLMGKVLKHYD